MPSSSEPAAASPDKPSVATSSDKPPPPDSVANSPLFKLPPELRNRIYGDVFGSSEAITPHICCASRASWANRWNIRDYDEHDDFPGEFQDFGVLTSILSVCQVVKAEAIEVLYGTKILRGYPIDLDVMLRSHYVSSRVRRIEITGLLDLVNSNSPHSRRCHTRHLRDMLERSQRLPRLNSIHITSDCLTSELRGLQLTWVPVTDFVQEAKLEPATCVDIGRYQLHGKFKNVQIVNKKLAEMWPAVRDTPEGYDGFDDAVAIINRLQSSIDVPNVMAWASHTSLRCWVDIQQQFLALKLSGERDRLKQEASRGSSSGDGDYTDDEFKFAFFKHAAFLATCVRMDEFPLLQSGEYFLKRLRPNEKSDVLSEASDFLAVNIVGYNHRNEHSSSGTH